MNLAIIHSVNIQASLANLSLASQSFFATPASLANAFSVAGRQSVKYPPLCGRTSSDTAQCTTVCAPASQETKNMNITTCIRIRNRTEKWQVQLL